MENKNILLVIASVCLFFIVVVGVGLWLFWPKQQTTTGAESAAARPPFDKEFDSFEFYKGRQDLPGLMEPPGEGKPGETGQSEGQKAAEGGPDKVKETTLTFGESGETVKIEKKDGTPGKTLPSYSPQKEQPAATRPKTTTQTPPQTAKRSTSAKKSQPQKVSVREYEIQVGSYKTRKGAESISERLKEVGLAGSIRTREINGETYYRVRVGPYSNRDEAWKFLSLLQDLDGMKDSYISQVTRQKWNN